LAQAYAAGSVTGYTTAHGQYDSSALIISIAMNHHHVFNIGLHG
jgi:hypothetical protein